VPLDVSPSAGKRPQRFGQMSQVPDGDKSGEYSHGSKMPLGSRWTQAARHWQAFAPMTSKGLLDISQIDSGGTPAIIARLIHRRGGFEGSHSIHADDLSKPVKD